MANGHQEDVILDAQTGLTREVGFEVETAQDLIAFWLTLINYDAQGIEKSRGIYVDKNRDGKIDSLEKKLWVFLSEKESQDSANQLMVNRYHKADGTHGRMSINVQLGREISGTVEGIDMGAGLFEAFTYDITLSDDLREISRTSRNSLGEIVIQSWEEGFDFTSRRAEIFNVTKWGTTSLDIIDTQSSLLRANRYENIEFAPGIFDTRETRINYTERGIFRDSATYSEALGQDIFFAQAISADGLTQEFTDQLKGGLVQEYVYNSIGLASEIKNQERRTAIHRDNSGLEKNAVTLDIRTNKTIITSDFRHTFTEAYGMRIKQDTTKEDTSWADYPSGIILGKGSEKLNPWGNTLEEITRSADGIDQKFVPEYGPGASEIGGKTYRYNPETGEWVLEKIHSDNQWNQGELTRKTTDEFKGRKETIETFSPDGLLREEAERFTLSNEYGYFVGIAQRGRAYIYDGSSVVNNPLISDRGPDHG